MSAREADLDGMLHVEGGSCCRPAGPCRACGGRRHIQGAFGGMLEVCEGCPRDAEQWRPAGTFSQEAAPLVVRVAP